MPKRSKAGRRSLWCGNDGGMQGGRSGRRCCCRRLAAPTSASCCRRPRCCCLVNGQDDLKGLLEGSTKSNPGQLTVLNAHTSKLDEISLTLSDLPKQVQADVRQLKGDIVRIFTKEMEVAELDFLYPSEGLHQRCSAGYRITSCAATPDHTAFIMSMHLCWNRNQWNKRRGNNKWNFTNQCSGSTRLDLELALMQKITPGLKDIFLRFCLV